MTTHEDLTKIRSEVNDHRVRISTVETLVDQSNKVQEQHNENIKDLTRSLNKLEKKFTVFITALIVSVGFGDPIASAFLKLLF